MTDKEAATDDLRVDLARIGIHDGLFRLDDRAGLALVVDAEHLVAQLVPGAGAGGGERLEDGDLALAIEDTAGVEGGDTGDGIGLLGGVEVGDFLVGEFEGWEMRFISQGCGCC